MMNRRLGRCALAATGVMATMGGGLLLAVPYASAAQSSQQILCGGDTYTIRTNSNNSSQNGGWSVGQVVGQPGAHGIPTSFSGVVTDPGAGVTVPVFSSVKGRGNANHNQGATTCTQTFTGTWNDISGGQAPPPGIGSGDQVDFVITIQVVLKQ